MAGGRGTVLRKEFIESVFSAGKKELDSEYIDAARRYGRLAIHYPSLVMPEGSVIRGSQSCGWTFRRRTSGTR